MADRMARLESLSTDERRILRVLSVICEPVVQTALQQVSGCLGLARPQPRPAGRRLREVAARAALAMG